MEGSGFEQHCVVGFFASEQEAQARAARLLRGDPDVKRHDFSEGTRRVKPYELRGNQRVRPKEVWACLLSAQVRAGDDQGQQPSGLLTADRPGLAQCTVVTDLHISCLPTCPFSRLRVSVMSCTPCLTTRYADGGCLTLTH